MYNNNKLLCVLTVTSALYALSGVAYGDDAGNAGNAQPASALPANAQLGNTPPANTQPGATPDILNLSLQQLSDVEVTSVSKKAEKESQAPAAIYVITQEDIRRSGLQSVPELLRMVPGLQVAQSGSQNWAITSRGFNGQFANDLLVMIDGRTIYTPVFGGVQWDIQNLMLEDIDRIEVIRGPGATLWGANAVNGVINIITKSAKDTQGTLITAATGNQERVGTAARYGGTVGDLSYRTYAQYFNDNQERTVANPVSGTTNGFGAQDQWHNSQGGFRMDWGRAGDKDQTTLQGDAYQGVENTLRYLPTVAAPYINVVDDTDDVSGMNILGRWKHELGAGSDITIQAYYDDVNRETEYVGVGNHTQTFDFDFQHNWTINSWNDITWGLGYRSINSDFGNSFYISFSPEDYYESLYSGFLQDKITLVQDKLFLTIGSKLEHNDFSGFEYEPSIRLAWTPTQTQTVWGAVSRSVHTPLQSDQNLTLVGGVLPPGAPGNPSGVLPAVLTGQGLSTAESEVVHTYEVGYRIQPKENISLDLTGFVNEYKSLDSYAYGNPAVESNAYGTYLVIPELYENSNSGETQGAEFAATWEATDFIKFSGSYSLYYETLHIVGATATVAEGTAPKQQFNIRSYVDLPYHLQWDTMVYYVDSLPGANDGFGDNITIPAYTRLDMRLGYTPFQGVDFSLIGQNLLQSEHQEYSPFLYQTPEEIGRSVIGKVTLRF